MKDKGLAAQKIRYVVAKIGAGAEFNDETRELLKVLLASAADYIDELEESVDLLKIRLGLLDATKN